MEKFKERFDKLLITKLGVKQEDIHPTAKFLEDLGADSLDMVELIIAFESEFDIAITDDEADKITLVNEAEAYLQRKINND